ncbi:MAG: peptidoglycan DD-metalloendopeptidase family protein [Neisseriaceae bacterium]|nr:peptidoglycan DD-metalloendopeptidase family protein [Neisseriaceae bacterium]
MMKLTKILCYTILLSAPLLQAAPVNDTKAKQVRQEIERANKKLKEHQSAQKQTAKNLANIQTELKKVQRELNEVVKQQQDATRKIHELQLRMLDLQNDIATTKAKISRLLLLNYQYPNQSTAALFLQQADVNEKSRFLKYTTYINRFNAHLIEQLKEQQNELQEQEKVLEEEQNRLNKLIMRYQTKARELGKNRSQADTINRQIGIDIKNQEKHLAKLREEERSLLEKINKLSKLKSKPSSTLTDEDKTLKQPKTASNKIYLSRPVSGSIQGQYGQKREDGRPWNGVFIATAPQAVKAAADGTVLMAEKYGTSGSMVIGIEHDDGSKTVYVGLSRVSVAKDSRVTRQQVIGQSGEYLGKQGLYFEWLVNGVRANPAPYFK